MVRLETRYDPIHGYNYTYWPDSKYFRNYQFSPPISWVDDWTRRSRVWFPYYWSTNRLFNHYNDYRPSTRSLREQRKTLYLDDPYPIKAVDYSYYPYSYKTYKPLSLYYDYYWPISSLNRYTNFWPHYPYYRYLYHKYTLPSDRYCHLKNVSMDSISEEKMIFLRDPISNITEYRVYPTPSYLRHKIYKPLSLYCDYYDPIRSLFWDSSYWPLYKTLGSFEAQCKGGAGARLKRIFDDETRLIRAQTASLLKRIHDPVPRVRSSWPVTVKSRYYDDGLPARLYNDNYIHRLLVTSPSSKTEYTTYFTEPFKKYIGAGHLASVSYAGDRVYNRRPHIYLYEDPLKSDIQLLSYYINRFKQEKAIAGTNEPVKVPLNPNRSTRKFTAKRLEDNEETSKEMQQLREARAARLAFINDDEKCERSSVAVDDAVKAKKKKEEERLAEERALAEEQAKRETQNKKEEAARKAEFARQEELAAQADAERAAELERKAELAKQAELEKERQEEQRRLDEEARAEEERKQLIRLEELAREAEEEKQTDLARQAEELAELARQEVELFEQAKLEAEIAEQARQEEELTELATQEAELEELAGQEAELAQQAEEEAEAAQREADEAARTQLEAEEEAEEENVEEELPRQEAELAEKQLEAEEELIATTTAEEAEEELIATVTAEEAENAEEELAKQEEELAELERQQAELDALEAEAQALECDQPEQEPEAQPTDEEDEEASKQREMDDLIQQKFELAELERQQAELDALDAEARALDCGASEAGDDEEEPAIAEDTPVQSDVEE